MLTPSLQTTYLAPSPSTIPSIIKASNSATSDSDASLVQTMKSYSDASLVQTMKCYWEEKARENATLSLLSGGSGQVFFKIKPGKSRPLDESNEQITSTISLDESNEQITSTISCAVKSVSIHSRTIHQVELFCRCCQGTFVVRAAHECGGDEDDDEDDDEVAKDDEEAGLEWLQDQGKDHINLTM